MEAQPKGMSDAAPFGVYVHWPFCAAKCPYCDFNSHVRHGGIDEARFLAAYLAELAHFAAASPGRTVTSVFFGGGTPSLMAPQATGAILEAIAGHWTARRRTRRSRSKPIPPAWRRRTSQAIAAAGVNRLSLGVQALDDASLKALGRLHTAAEALAALTLARDCFDRVSFDLIYAREGPIAGCLDGRTHPRARLCRRSPVALPAHHRGRHALRRAARGRTLTRAGKRGGAGDVSC